MPAPKSGDNLAIMTEATDIILTDSRRNSCDGASAIAAGSALGHPRVFLEIDEKGYVECGYCGRKFILKNGPADNLSKRDAAAA